MLSCLGVFNAAAASFGHRAARVLLRAFLCKAGFEALAASARLGFALALLPVIGLASRAVVVHHARYALR